MTALVTFLLSLLSATLAMGIWIPISLIIVGWAILSLFTPASPSVALPTLLWSSTASWTLSSLPLFVWMGEILFRTKLSNDLFRGCAVWFGWLPGRLLHVNIVACAVFGTVCGSSAATCATIAKIAVPELIKRGYKEDAVLGSLAAAGTLGVMLPPSIVMIIYGVAAEVSILRVFLAGISVGILQAALMIGWIVISSLLDPDSIPLGERYTWRERWDATARLLPTTFLILIVFVAMASGWATSTEAAAVGVVGSFAVAFWHRQLTWQLFIDSAYGTMRTSVMIMFIIATSEYFSLGLAYTGVPAQLAASVAELHLSPYAVIAVLTLIYILLGTALDGSSMIVLTVAVVVPIVQQAGFDLVWFGVYMVLVVEMATISPPVGLNLYVLQAMTGRDSLVIARATIPYFMTMVVGAVIMTVWPELVTWLPNKLM